MYELFSKKNYINLLAISDLHLCSKFDRIDLLYKAYEYAYKNNIKYVINLGDLIDSDMPHNKKTTKFKSLYKQIEYVIDNYPYSNDIKTLILYGNHDYYSKLNGVDIVKELKKERTDLISLGYGENFINISNNYIKLQHEISYLKNYKQNIETYITLLGHYHNYRVEINSDNTYVYVPSLSNLGTIQNINIPSMLDIKISLFNELFSNINIKCIDVEKEIISNEFNININVKKKQHQIIEEHIKKMH